MAEVRLNQIHKRYGTVHAVKDVNLTVADEEFVVLVGPSGCGKSTTLRMIAGIEETTEGEIYIGNRRVNFVPPKDRDIAMVFQNYALYPHMSVYKNLAFGLKQRKLPKSVIDQRVTEVAELLGIDDLLARKPKELSGGQRQRALVARALIRKPNVLLLDEPTNGLDLPTSDTLMRLLATLNRQDHMTILFVTHDVALAGRYATHAILLRDSHVVAGPMKEVLTRSHLTRTYGVEVDVSHDADGMTTVHVAAPGDTL